MRIPTLLFATSLTLACSDDLEEDRPLDASNGDASTRTMDAAKRLDDARTAEAGFRAGDHFCANWNVEVARAAVKQLPQPLMSQCAAYGDHRPAQPTRGPQFADGGVFDFNQLADFVSVEELAPGSYASKYALFCEDCSFTYDVYDASLERVIGRVAPGGYVTF